MEQSTKTEYLEMPLNGLFIAYIQVQYAYTLYMLVYIHNTHIVNELIISFGKGIDYPRHNEAEFGDDGNMFPYHAHCGSTTTTFPLLYLLLCAFPILYMKMFMEKKEG